MSMRCWMRPARRLALEAYYHLTRPYRTAANRQASAQGAAPVMVLFYHRVADEWPNDWTIDPRTFERQMNWLRRRCDMVSLAEAQRRIREGNSRPAVSITFDDGYADNGRHAIPLLLKLQIPCTYFVSSQFARTGEPFPHDVAAGRPLVPNSPDELRALAEAGVEIGGHTRSHADLGRIHDPKKLYDEVIGGAEELADMIGRSVRYFAFPFGRQANLNHTAADLLRDHGFAGICSAYGGYNFPGDDPFHLQRIHGDPEFVRLRNWITVDPRKRRIPRVQFVARSSERSGAEIRTQREEAGS